MSYETKKYFCDNCGNEIETKYTLIYTPEDTELNRETTDFYCSPECVVKDLK